MFRRHAENALHRWLKKSRRKPLIVRGARQVGKSTLVRQFAKTQGLELLELNLEQHAGLNVAFATLDPATILREISAQARKSVGPNTLLFLDEIQATPAALPALRYLYESRPELAVVAAGSLLEFLLQSGEHSMPVGRIEYLHLAPLTFEEFLGALGEDYLLDLLRTWNQESPWPSAAHQHLQSLQREFLAVGGMPEAVAIYAESRDFELVTDAHRSLLETYADDFGKYGSTATLPRLQKVFRAIPGLVGQKIKYVNIDREAQARDLRPAIELLALARVIWKVPHSDCSGPPLEAQLSASNYKCLFLDVGLMNHQLSVGWLQMSNLIGERLVHEGSMAEQFIGQELMFRHKGAGAPSLCYWLREGKRNNAEVDYVITVNGQIVPVEVKAGKSGSLRSLHQFVALKLATTGLKGATTGSPLALRFDMNAPSLQELDHPIPGNTQRARYRLLSLPLYLVGQSERLLSACQ